MREKATLLTETPDLDAEHLIKVLEGRWKLHILLQLSAGGAMRFSQLARSIPNISKRMLTQQLKQMQTDGLVRRLTSDGTAARVEYQLTDWGRGLAPSLATLVEWAQKAPRHLKGKVYASDKSKEPIGRRSTTGESRRHENRG